MNFAEHGEMVKLKLSCQRTVEVEFVLISFKSVEEKVYSETSLKPPHRDESLVMSREGMVRRQYNTYIKKYERVKYALPLY